MTDLNSLLRAVITNPDEDTPRLMYADALDELPTVSEICSWCEGSGEDGPDVFVDGELQKAVVCRKCKGTKFITDTTNQDRAEFIRLQVEIAKYPKRRVVSEEVALTTAGPGYYLVASGARVDGGGVLSMENLKVGDRIDFRKAGKWSWKRDRILYGLRFLKFADDTEEEAVFVKDAESVPCPSEKLRKREKELINPINWVLLAAPSNWKRGFVESLRCTAQDFLKHGPDLVWDEKQTIDCSSCEGAGWQRWSIGHGDYDEAACDRCENGKLQRPCPDTAHPIRKVVLTSTMEHEELLVGGVDGRTLVRVAGETVRIDHNYTIKELYEARWPGLEFEVRETEPHQRLLVGARVRGEVVVIEAGDTIRNGDLLVSDAQGRAVPFRRTLLGQGPTPELLIGQAVTDSYLQGHRGTPRADDPEPIHEPPPPVDDERARRRRLNRNARNRPI